MHLSLAQLIGVSYVAASGHVFSTMGSVRVRSRGLTENNALKCDLIVIKRRSKFKSQYQKQDIRASVIADFASTRPIHFIADSYQSVHFTRPRATRCFAGQYTYTYMFVRAREWARGIICPRGL
jgi:hypothetical protein